MEVNIIFIFPRVFIECSKPEINFLHHKGKHSHKNKTASTRRDVWKLVVQNDVVTQWVFIVVFLLQMTKLTYELRTLCASVVSSHLVFSLASSDRIWLPE